VAGIVAYPSDGAGAVEVAPIDPDAIIDYNIDWSKWLAQVGGADTILTSVWTINNATEASSSNTGSSAQVFIQNAKAGKIVTMRNRIVTVGGRTEDRTLRAEVREK